MWCHRGQDWSTTDESSEGSEDENSVNEKSDDGKLVNEKKVQSGKMAHIKMMPFSETHTVGWFRVLEAQFEVKSITISQTKFGHAFSFLPADLSERLDDSLMQSKDYDQLKKAVIETYQKSKPELFEKLINDTKLTGRPSLYLQELNAIAKKVGVGEDLVRHRFIQALPPALGPAIASQRDAPLDQLGKLADELMPFTKVSALQVQAANDVQEVNRIQEARPANARPTSSTNWNARPTSSTNRDLIPFWEGQRNRICRSHIFYGNRAHTCKAWCHWPNKANCRISPNSRPSSPIRMDQPEN